jgi:ribosomal protein L21E
MGNGNFKIGDRVVVSERYGLSKQRLKGKTGTVIEKSSWLGIEFDEFINGHSCSGRGKDGYCYRVPAGDVDYISEGRSVVVIHRNNRETIATLKDGKTILKTAKASCNPSDTFNAEFGRSLALARLNDDQKMIDFLLKGEENPFVPTQSRIVKQDKYEVGDKVKIIDNWVHGCHQNSDGKMDKWLGKMMTVRQVNVSDYKMSEDKEDSFWGNGWAWNALCIEGKVIEETISSGHPVTAPVNTPFDWEGFKSGKFAVHCDTEEKVKQFFDELKMHGIKWNSGTELKNYDPYWSTYKQETAYIHRIGLEFCNLDYYKEHDYKIIPYTPNYREVKRPAKAGDWIKVVAEPTVPYDEYKKGDLLKCVRPDEDIVPSYEKEAAFYKNEKCKYLTYDEYVVLEPVAVVSQHEVNFDLATISDKELLAEVSRRLEK